MVFLPVHAAEFLRIFEEQVRSLFSWPWWSKRERKREGEVERERQSAVVDNERQRERERARERRIKRERERVCVCVREAGAQKECLVKVCEAGAQPSERHRSWISASFDTFIVDVVTFLKTSLYITVLQIEILAARVESGDEDLGDVSDWNTKDPRNTVDIKTGKQGYAYLFNPPPPPPPPLPSVSPHQFFCFIASCHQPTPPSVSPHPFFCFTASCHLPSGFFHEIP